MQPQTELRKIAKDYLPRFENAATPKDVGTILGEVTQDSRLSMFERDHLVGQARSKVRALTGAIEHEAPQGADGAAEPAREAPESGSNRNAGERGLATPTAIAANPSGAAVPALMPAVPASEMRAAIKAWDEQVAACVRAEDICQIDGHDYWRVTAWRRLAMAYNIEVIQRRVSSASSNPDHEGTPSAEVCLELVAPNGRKVETIGMCHGRERRFKKKDGSWQDASEHVIVSLAWTRAFCRGMRVLIGFGEPALEEVE